jgi:hypothetical protein
MAFYTCFGNSTICDAPSLKNYPAGAEGFYGAHGSLTARSTGPLEGRTEAAEAGAHRLHQVSRRALQGSRCPMVYRLFKCSARMAGSVIAFAQRMGNPLEGSGVVLARSLTHSMDSHKGFPSGGYDAGRRARLLGHLNTCLHQGVRFVI